VWPWPNKRTWTGAGERNESMQLQIKTIIEFPHGVDSSQMALIRITRLKSRDRESFCQFEASSIDLDLKLH
jgi:hypothetical protein